MITVIDPKPHHSVVKQCVCKNCGATLQYTPNDVARNSYRDYGGGNEIEYSIICPQCTCKVCVQAF